MTPAERWQVVSLNSSIKYVLASGFPTMRAACDWRDAHQRGIHALPLTVERTPPPAPKFKLVASGLYDTEDGIFTMHQLQGVYPPAWNVEWQTAFACEHRYSGDDLDRATDLADTIIDGARTKRDAVALFADWWEETGSKLPLLAEVAA